MKFKKHDIVKFIRRRNVVALITHVAKVSPDKWFRDGGRYSVRFLSESPECGDLAGSHEIRLATMREVTQAICKGLLPAIDENCEMCHQEGKHA